MSIYVLVILGESRDLGVSGISGWSAPFTFRALRQWMKLESTPPNGWNFEGELTQTCKFFAKLRMEYGWNMLGNLEKSCSKSVTLMNKLCTDCI